MRPTVVRFLVSLLVVIVSGGTGWAQGADPLRPISGAAVMPYYNVNPGNEFFLLVASPGGDNSGAIPGTHAAWLFFYDVTCLLRFDVPIPLTENDVQVVSLSSLGGGFLPSSQPEGAILIAGGATNGARFALNAPVIVRGFWVDVKEGVTRVLDPAGATAEGVGGQSWSPYERGSIYIFAPPDDGKNSIARVLFSCPRGDIPGTLAYDMGAASGVPFTPNDQIPTTESVKLDLAIFDTDETFLGTVNNVECPCAGFFPRLSDLHPVTSTRATYIKIRSNHTQHQGASGGMVTILARHMGYMDIDQKHKGKLVGFHSFGRLHPTSDTIFPGE